MRTNNLGFLVEISNLSVYDRKVRIENGVSKKNPLCWYVHKCRPRRGKKQSKNKPEENNYSIP